jgi:2-polyprenyl-3-methyl-5-hydroxy-6-metoxy-1,4-benzoquinol methylase
VLTLTKRKGKSVLDLCCGPGRCSIDLAQRGFAVTGVDRTRFLIDKARAKARAARVKIEWIQEDMRNFVRANTYDLALSMFTSFRYFDNREEDMTVLGNIFTSLRAGGVLLVEMMGKELVAKIFLATTSNTLSDGTMIVQKREIFDDWTRISQRVDHRPPK